MTIGYYKDQESYNFWEEKKYLQNVSTQCVYYVLVH